MSLLKNALYRTTLVAVALVVALASSPIALVAAEGTPAPEKKSYSYDEATGRWNSDACTYTPSVGNYVCAPPPAPAPVPTTSSPAPSAAAPAQSLSSAATISPQATTGPGSTSTLSTDVTGEASHDTSSAATITNTLNSSATSGDADVQRNTEAGDAKTGNASVQTTTINSIHSTVGGETAGVAHFTVDVDGDVTGDIMLRPVIDDLKSTSNTNLSSDTKIKTDATIVNDINLDATSGDATVLGNTKAGDATTGSAHTVANVMNLINSLITANESFIGTINIYGNLNGDILISPEFIPQLIGSNTSVQNSLDTQLDILSNSNQSIINNIHLNATSGDAHVAYNTAAGSARSGEANTNLTVLNLTGREVDADNSMLVFVNVLGTWVGMIVDAPGATAAALGSGITKNTTKLAANIEEDSDAQITNNISLNSQSGDASVVGNTEAGNATTGDATASANIANINTSVFQVNQWFGVLFINVFGNWVGSFGIDTESGTLVPLSAEVPTRSTPKTDAAPNLKFEFVPKAPADQASAPATEQWWPSYSPAQRAVGVVSELPAPVAHEAVQIAAALTTGDTLGAMATTDNTPHVRGSAGADTQEARSLAFTLAIVGMVGAAGYGFLRRFW